MIHAQPCLLFLYLSTEQIYRVNNEFTQNNRVLLGYHRYNYNAYKFVIQCTGFLTDLFFHQGVFWRLENETCPSQSSFLSVSFFFRYMNFLFKICQQFKYYKIVSFNDFIKIIHRKFLHNLYTTIVDLFFLSRPDLLLLDGKIFLQFIFGNYRWICTFQACACSSLIQFDFKSLLVIIMNLNLLHICISYLTFRTHKHVGHESHYLARELSTGNIQ